MKLPLGASGKLGMARRLREVPPILLCILDGNLAGGTSTVDFRVTNPDARCTMKLVVYVDPPAGTVQGNVGGKGLGIWLAAGEWSTGASGQIMKVTNLEGTAAAPFAFPVDSGLGGYGREFTTSADTIEGRLTVPPQLGDGHPVNIILQAALQPAPGFDPTDEQWAEIAARFQADILGPVLHPGLVVP